MVMLKYWLNHYLLLEINGNMHVFVKLEFLSLKENMCQVSLELVKWFLGKICFYILS